MCGHHALQPRFLLKAHAIISGLQRSVQLSPMLGIVVFPHWITTPANPPVQEGVFCVLNAVIIYKALLLNVPEVSPAGQFQSNCVQFIPAE